MIAGDEGNEISGPKIPFALCTDSLSLFAPESSPKNEGRVDLIDNLLRVSDGCSFSPPNIYPEIEDSELACAVQMVKGSFFPNVDAFRQALYKYSISHKFSYKFKKINKEKIIAYCKVEGCEWNIVAYSIGKDNEILRVTKFNNDHTHNAQDNLIVSHSARSKLTSSIMVDALRSNIDKGANELARDLYREYGVRLSYSQAYRGRKKALREIHGRAEDSYSIIPWIYDQLMETDPMTVAKWNASNDRFERLFIAYGCSISGFLGGCRAILYVDGCHLSGPYKGTMLSAYITRSVELTIISDRNNAIIGAVQAIFGSGERHAFCYRHVKENFSTAFTKINRGKMRTSSNMKDDALKLLDTIAYARHEVEFNVAMENLRLFCPQLAQWVETQGDVDRWAQCKFGYKRWDNITTNLAESFNAWIVKERKHNVNVLIHEHREKLAKKMVASKAAMGNWKHGVGPNIEAKVMEQVVRAKNLHAQIYRENLISVQTISVNGLIHLNVDLAARTCSFLAWQMSGIPCAHACAAIKLLYGNVYNFWMNVTSLLLKNRYIPPV
ncbi:uncharacterized protein LOC129286465 [Prosopis cineraria]|uniref:uncharacterized protein LOC129286465 n=1 Tax=Prosopis cineraria TaxID=364024 RepID=UPI00240FFC25|nr:uncharacterized protein LOC129286465 [Prosopis cineraria]